LNLFTADRVFLIAGLCTLNPSVLAQSVNTLPK
jgi:hypothetical protein